MGYFFEEFFLQCPTARRLFHELAMNQPIIDCHCHLYPKGITTVHPWGDLPETSLGGDHYKWCLMRANNVNEDLITGTAAPRENFLAWTETGSQILRNPVHRWTHLDLRRYFGINLPLRPGTADEIRERAHATLTGRGFSARRMLDEFDVRVGDATGLLFLPWECSPTHGHYFHFPATSVSAGFSAISSAARRMFGFDV